MPADVSLTPEQVLIQLKVTARERELTKDEVREALAALRQARRTASEAASTAKTRSTANRQVRSADELVSLFTK